MGREAFNIKSHCRANTIPRALRSDQKASIVEGAYSMHPTLIGHYDLRIFLSIHPEKQIQRILKGMGRMPGTLYPRVDPQGEPLL